MQAPPSYDGSTCVPVALGTLRNRELRREMGNIIDAAWASTWKGFIAGSIAERRSYDEIRPRLKYSLTEKGTPMAAILQSICRWARFIRSRAKSP